MMNRIERIIEIKAPMEKVFAYVTDVENFAKNQLPEMVFEVPRKERLPRVGFTATVRAKAGGNTWEVEDETIDLVKNKKHAGRQKGGPLEKFEHIERCAESTKRHGEVD